jgi:hypothetical protein
VSLLLGPTMQSSHPTWEELNSRLLSMMFNVHLSFLTILKLGKLYPSLPHPITVNPVASYRPSGCRMIDVTATTLPIRTFSLFSSQEPRIVLLVWVQSVFPPSPVPNFPLPTSQFCSPFGLRSSRRQSRSSAKQLLI